MTYPFDVPVYWSVHEAPFGHTRDFSMRAEQALYTLPNLTLGRSTRSGQWRYEFRDPLLWLQTIDSVTVQTPGSRLYGQNTKYVPLADLQSVGSCTAVLPVTLPGPTTARARVANARTGAMESRSMVPRLDFACKNVRAWVVLILIVIEQKKPKAPA